MYPFLGGDSVEGGGMEQMLPSINMILPYFTRFDRKGQTKTEENAQKPFRFACNRAVEYRIDRRSSAPAVFLL